MYCAKSVPCAMDWPTIVCVHAMGLPAASSPATKRSCHIGRYQPPARSSSRVQTTFTGALAILATCTASTTKSETGLARRSPRRRRSEEHTSELQSHHDLVCRLLLEKKKR